MSKEIQTQKVCVLLRGETKLWIEGNRVEELEKALRDSTKRFLKINGQLVNTFEIIGVFTPDLIEERNRYKNGQWKCEKGKWHDKGQKCECVEYTKITKAYVEGIGEIEYKS